VQAVDAQVARCTSHGVSVEQVLIMGDFNVDFKQGTIDDKQTTMQCFMQANNFTVVSPTAVPTHDNGSHIDSIWRRATASEVNVASGISPSYWSDHSSVWAQLYTSSMVAE
jgi:endonuclease/exonuclease/phosphatase family metal-dependent hydrolase